MRVSVKLAAAFTISISIASAAEQPKIVKLRDDCSRHLTAHVPAYRLDRSTRLEKDRTLVLYISIAPDDAGQESLIALACSLGKQYATETFLYAYLFDSRFAAKHYNPQHEGNTAQEEASYLGAYSFARLPELYGAQLSVSTKKGNSNRVDIDLGPPPVNDPNSKN
jgi:hypothetical protein